LDDECRDIEPEKLRAAGFTEEELRAMVKDLIQYVRTHGDKYLVVPFMRWCVVLPPEPGHSSHKREI
jgi:hypothetical protein